MWSAGLVHPPSHAHVKLPTVSVHTAPAWQLLSCGESHSLRSTHEPVLLLDVLVYLFG